MKCPRDGTHLARVIVDGVEIDKCHKCDGIWCDRGEMERLRDRKIADVEELQALERWLGLRCDGDLAPGHIGTQLLT